VSAASGEVTHLLGHRWPRKHEEGRSYPLRRRQAHRDRRPFAESKELIAGYTIIDVPSKTVALEWAMRFGAVVLGAPGMCVLGLNLRPSCSATESRSGSYFRGAS
jgi:hypothetical protein